MSDAESKPKQKRIRRCFSINEIHHRFIHSEEYAYAPKGRYICSCRGNYLLIGVIHKTNTVEDIEECWGYNETRAIAVIHRGLRRIIVNRTYKDVYRDLRDAIPDDYTVYYTNDCIPKPDILLDKRQCLEIHSKYLVENHVDTKLRQFYELINKKCNTVHSCLETDWLKSSVDSIIEFVKANKIKKEDFYTKCFNEDYYLYGYGKNEVTIKLPTLKQIVTNTVFSKKDRLYIEQRYFYTKYCYGKGIPFKDVVDFWDKDYSKRLFVAYCNKTNIYYNEDWFNDSDTWKNYIIKVTSCNKNIETAHRDRQLEIANESYKEALAELERRKNNPITVDAWRSYENVKLKPITYKRWVAGTKIRPEHFVEQTLYDSGYNKFANIQLRLTKDRRHIETSNGAKVPFADGVRMFKMFVTGRKNNPNATRWTTKNFGNVKVGIYNLRFIEYTDKRTVFFAKLGYKEWVIQIGCHALWLDDIIDFVKYYHLEEEFELYKYYN